MTATRRQSGNDNSFTRSTGDAAMRGALLIGAAVVIGLLLLWKGVIADDGGTSQATTGTTTTVTPGASSTVPGGSTTVKPGTPTTAPASTVAPAPVTRPPAQVAVLVANGSGTAGIAGRVTEKLKSLSYNGLTPANAASTPKSTIYYRTGYVEEAKAVAAIFGLPVTQVLELPAGQTAGLDAAGQKTLPSANVIVVAGADGIVKA